MIRTIKIRIYPNSSQQKALIKMMQGVDFAWNELNKLQSDHMKKHSPVGIEIKKDSKGRDCEDFFYKSTMTASVEVPYKDGSIKIKEEKIVFRWETLSHFLGQYTTLGKKLIEGYGLPSTAATNQIPKEFNKVIDKITKDNKTFKNYIHSEFRIKNKEKANWIPFNNGAISLDKKNKNKFTFNGMSIRMCSDKRTLFNLVNNLDERLLNKNILDIKKSLKTGSFLRTTNNKWFLTVVMDVLPTKQVELKEGCVSLDPGFNTCITTNEGDKYKRPLLSELETKKKELQRKACKSKGGKARVITRTLFSKKKHKKVKCLKYSPSMHVLKKVNIIEKKITNLKRDWEWSVANSLVSKGKTIFIGDIGIKGMQQNFGKSIKREAIFTLWGAIESKAADYGIKTIRVNESGTTKTCSSCGEKTGPSGQEGLSVREWVCSNCQAQHDRDINAAKNILKKGIEMAKIEEEKKKTSGQNLAVINAAKEEFVKCHPDIDRFSIKTKVKKEKAGDFTVSIHKKHENIKKTGDLLLKYSVLVRKDGSISSVNLL